MNPSKRYRQFRQENRYDSPLLIFIVDTALMLLRFCLIAILFMAAWAGVNSLRFAKTATAVAMPDTISTIEASAITLSSEAVKKTQPGKTVPDTRLPVMASSPTDKTAAATTSQVVNQTLTKPAPAAADNAAQDPENSPTGVVPVKTGPLKAVPLKTVTVKSIAIEPIPVKTVQAEPRQAEQSDTKPPVITDEDWILGMDPASYIVQFAASENTALFDEFIPVLDKGEPISIYPYKLTPNGQPLYGIATGLYNNRETAEAAVESLSAQARAYKPWIRKVADLTIQIERVIKIIQTQ